MQLDSPLVELAERISKQRHGRPFVLFLGTGCGRAAEVPTVKEIALSTFKDLAERGYRREKSHLAFEDWEVYASDPEADDTVLLEAFYRLLDESPSARYTLLETYYQELPIPHFYQDLARLARDSYFEHILTTNIDTLLEEALDEEGMYAGRDYAVVNLAAEKRRLEAMPTDADMGETLTIVKLHGDVAGLAVAISPAEIEEALRRQWRLVEGELASDMVIVGYDFESEPINGWLKLSPGQLWWVSKDADQDVVQELTERPVRMITGPEADPTVFFGALRALVEGGLHRERRMRESWTEQTDPTAQGTLELAGDEVSEEEIIRLQVLQQQLSSSKAVRKRILQQPAVTKGKGPAQLEYEEQEIARLETQVRELLAPSKRLIEILDSVASAASEADADEGVLLFLNTMRDAVRWEYDRDEPNQDVIAAAVGAAALLVDRLDTSVIPYELYARLRAVAPSAVLGGQS
jgi:hypothetical protein